MHINKTHIIIGIAVIIIASTLYIVWNRPEAAPVPSVWETGIPANAANGQPVASVAEPALNSENAKQFTHEGLRISFLYPNDLKPSHIAEEDGSELILLQNAEKGRGIQILITPFDEPGSVLTVERIKQDIPDMDIREAQPILLGEHSGRGVAFLSDNESFAGNSREVWFVYKGRLYQISTYARLDTLLQSILATWKFE